MSLIIPEVFTSLAKLWIIVALFFVTCTSIMIENRAF